METKNNKNKDQNIETENKKPNEKIYFLFI